MHTYQLLLLVSISLTTILSVCGYVPEIKTPSGDQWRSEIREDEGTFAGFLNQAQIVQTIGGMLHPLDTNKDKLYSKPTEKDQKDLQTLIQSANLVLKSNSSLHNLCQTPDYKFLHKWQSPLKNQLDRGTSAAFAAAAALEAAYNRTQRRNIDVSEQFVHWISRSTAIPLSKKYDSISSYWGGGNSHQVLQALQDYAAPSETWAPYKNEQQMEELIKRIPKVFSLTKENTSQQSIDNFEMSALYISTQAKQHARYGVRRFVKLWKDDVQNVCNLEKILSMSQEILIDVRLSWSEKHGVMNFNSAIKSGYHTLLLVGYDKSAGVFLAKNSWGGDNYMRLSYLFVQRAALGGAVVTEVIQPRSYDAFKRRMAISYIGKWYTDFDGVRGRAIIRRVRPSQNIGSFYPVPRFGNNGTLIKGHLKNKGTSLHMNVNDVSYEMFVHRRNPKLISGIGRSYPITGAIMSKSYIPRRQPKTAYTINKLLGVWNLTIDGKFVGKLQVGPKVSPVKYESDMKQSVKVKYQDAEYSARFARGTFLYTSIFGTEGHVLRVKADIATGTRSYVRTLWLFYHTQERGVLSGYTRDIEGQIVGVMGFKEPRLRYVRYD